MKKMFVIVILLGSLLLSACTFTLSMDGKEVGSLDPCKVTGVTSDLCAETATVTTDDEATPEATKTVVPDTEEVTPAPVLDGTDTYRGFRLDFIERSIGRVIVEETLIEGPALHQDRDGNVTVIRKNASATFISGIVWLYKVGDANSIEDEIIFLENQIKFFNDPNPIWIESTP